MHKRSIELALQELPKSDTLTLTYRKNIDPQVDEPLFLAAVINDQPLDDINGPFMLSHCPFVAREDESREGPGPLYYGMIHQQHMNLHILGVWRVIQVWPKTKRVKLARLTKDTPTGIWMSVLESVGYDDQFSAAYSQTCEVDEAREVAACIPNLEEIFIKDEDEWD